MNERGKSDGRVVPAKPANKAAVAAAESVEERRPAEGNMASKTRPGHRAGTDALSALDRVREVARKDKEARFTALLHHVDVAPLGGLLGDPPAGRAGGGRGDVGRLRAGIGGEPPGPARAGARRALPGETITQGVHPEGGRAATAARHRHAGGQDRPAGRRRGAQRRLRGGLSGLLLWVSAGASSASCVGCAHGRDLAEEGELGARCGYPRLLGCFVTLRLSLIVMIRTVLPGWVGAG